MNRSTNLVMFGLKVLLFTICFSWSDCKLDKYCSVCEDHTMCKYHGIGQDCDDVGGFGVTHHEKKEIVEMHNWFRRIIAGGFETKGKNGAQPKAADMYALTWDDELAKVAQRWADQCRFQHDACRNDPRWKVGQNIYWKWKYPVHNVNWTEAIDSWYNEVSLYNGSEVGSYRFDSATGHYTQLIWHDTYAVGCGRRDYGPNKLYVCNYGPAGNWLDEPMYTVGEPCSKCPHGTFCNENLCDSHHHHHTSITTIKPEKKEIETNAITHSPGKEAPTTKKCEGMESLDVLKPPKANAKHTYDSEGKEAEVHKPSNQTNSKVAPKFNILNILDNNSSEEQKSRTNGNVIENDNIVLDAETRSGIEEIKIKVEKLVKKVIRKMKSSHN